MPILPASQAVALVMTQSHQWRYSSTCLTVLFTHATGATVKYFFKIFNSESLTSHCLVFVTKDHRERQVWALRPSQNSPLPNANRQATRAVFRNWEQARHWGEMSQGIGAQSHVSFMLGSPPQWDNAHQTSILWPAMDIIGNMKEGKPAVWLSCCLFLLKRQRYKTTVELWQQRDLSHFDVFSYVIFKI